MKKLIFIIIASLFATGCANLQAHNSYSIHFHHHGNYNSIIDMPGTRLFIPSSLEDLEYEAPNIVRGRMGNDPVIVYQYNYNGDRSFPTHNKVSLEIIDVIRGDLVVGETISILEPYLIEDNILYTWANYLPSMPYHEYFFFLGYQLEEIGPSGRALPESYVGAYFVWYGEFGRHRVPDMMSRGGTAFSFNELSLGSRANTDLYLSVWQEVINAYMDWGQPPITSHRFQTHDEDWLQEFDMIMD